MKLLLRCTSLILLLSAGMATLPGCASGGANSPSARPVLYPNATQNRMGEARAQDQIDACMANARSAGIGPAEESNDVSRRAGQGATLSGVAAAVGALVTGRGLDGAVRSGAAGAVVGGSVGAVSGAMNQRPSSLFRTYVQRCMADRGLDVIGWN